MEKVLSGYVGFGNLPSQVSQKSVTKGFEFTLMVVGASGLGKSTLVNSLFLSNIYAEESYKTKIPKTTSIHSTKVDLSEKDINLCLTLVDTPGYGDLVNNDDCWKPILNYINEMYDEYFQKESAINRCSFEDRRVHCCLYFISPNGHGLKSIDIYFMKTLHERVNLIPVIAKSDTLSPEELIKFKSVILEDIRNNSIQIYDFSYKLALNENDFGINSIFIERMPFGIVGSPDIFEVEGKFIRGRRYPWGIIDINNIEHCDFSLLRDILVRYHMLNLKDLVHNNLYENFRSNKIGYQLQPCISECTYDIDAETLYNDEYDSLFVKHKQILENMKQEKILLINEISKKFQMLNEKKAKLLDEKKLFEIEHANFIKILSETGRSTNLSAKKISKKKN